MIFRSGIDAMHQYIIPAVIRYRDEDVLDTTGFPAGVRHGFVTPATARHQVEIQIRRGRFSCRHTTIPGQGNGNIMIPRQGAIEGEPLQAVDTRRALKPIARDLCEMLIGRCRWLEPGLRRPGGRQRFIRKQSAQEACLTYLRQPTGRTTSE